MTAGEVLLAGFPVIADQVVEWGYFVGTRPWRQLIRVDRFVGERILEATENNKPTTIKVAGETWNGVFVTDVYPGMHETELVLEVQDLRWTWSYPIVGPWGFNMRKRTGDRRWVDDSGRLDDVGPSGIAQDVWFHPWSLLNGFPYNGQECITEVVNDLRAVSTELVKWEFDTVPPVKSVAIDSLPITRTGGQALDMALRQVVGLGCYINKEPRLKWISILDGSEAQIVRDFVSCHEREHGRRPLLVRKSRKMPRAWRIYFDTAYTVRVGFSYSGGAGIALAGGIPTVQNVTYVVDPVLEVDGRDLVFGQVAEMDGYLSALHTQPRPASTWPVNPESVRKLWALGGMMMEWASTGLSGGLKPDPIWKKRVAGIYRDWWQLFQLPKGLRDIIRTWKAQDVGLIDPETGTRGRSMIFADHGVIYPVDRIERTSGPNNEIIRTVPTYLRPGAFDAATTRLSSAESSGAFTIEEDIDLGLFRANYAVLNQWQSFNEVIPGAIMDRSGLFSSAGRKDETIDDLYSKGVEAVGAAGWVLADVHDLATKITVWPAKPQGSTKLYSVIVSQAEIEQALGVTGGQSRGTGPMKDILCPESRASVRVAWVDGGPWPSKILGAIGYGPGLVLPEDLEELVVDRKHIHAVALSLAASDYLGWTDRIEGDLSIPFVDGSTRALLPTGRIYQVMFSSNGRVEKTAVRFNNDVPNPPFTAFLDQNTLERFGFVPRADDI
jgi:hypothetical protein